MSTVRFNDEEIIDLTESTLTTNTTSTTPVNLSNKPDSVNNQLVMFGFLSPGGNHPHKLNREENEKLISFFKIVQKNAHFLSFLKDSFLIISHKESSENDFVNKLNSNFQFNLYDLARCVVYFQKIKAVFLNEDETKKLFAWLEERLERYVGQYNHYLNLFKSPVTFSTKQYGFIVAHKEVKRLEKVLPKKNSNELNAKLNQMINEDPDLNEAIGNYYKIKFISDDKNNRKILNELYNTTREKPEKDESSSLPIISTIAEKVKIGRDRKRPLNSFIDFEPKKEKKRKISTKNSVVVEQAPGASQVQLPDTPEAVSTLQELKGNSHTLGSSTFTLLAKPTNTDKINISDANNQFTFSK